MPRRGNERTVTTLAPPTNERSKVAEDVHKKFHKIHTERCGIVNKIICRGATFTFESHIIALCFY